MVRSRTAAREGGTSEASGGGDAGTGHDHGNRRRRVAVPVLDKGEASREALAARVRARLHEVNVPLDRLCTDAACSHCNPADLSCPMCGDRAGFTHEGDALMQLSLFQDHNARPECRLHRQFESGTHDCGCTVHLVWSKVCNDCLAQQSAVAVETRARSWNPTDHTATLVMLSLILTGMWMMYAHWYGTFAAVG